MHRVLIIEDDANTRAGLQELLQCEGYEVIAVPDGSSAVAMIAAGSDVDTVITDYRLPDTTGIRVIQQLASDLHDRQAILMTAFLTPEIQVRAKQAGIQCCMIKPLDIERLLATMRPPP